MENIEDRPTRPDTGGRPRKAAAAVLLSIAATGLGHIYCGRLAKGLILFFASFAFAPVIVAASNIAASTFMLVVMIGSIALMMGIVVYAAVDSGLTARKMTGGYSLKEYNRWYIYLLLIVVGLAYPSNFAHTIRENVFQAFKVPSVSMSPGILQGDLILLNKAVYKTQAPRRGEVVIFIYPDDRRLFYLKRIAALPGDTVEIRDNVLIVNDHPVTSGRFEEPSALHFSPEGSQQIMMETADGAPYPVLVDSKNPRNMEKITIPHGHCFVLGDNRIQSTDSRNFGPVPLSDIKGRTDYIYWPSKSWSRFGPYRRQ